MPGARWPGWTARHTVLLPVSHADWPRPEAPVTIGGVTLQPKAELHITLIGTRLGQALRDAGRAGRVDPDAVPSAFRRLDWGWKRTGRQDLLRAPPKEGRGPVRYAVVEHVELPAMARFHESLGKLLGEVLPVPPPHVTLYVAGTDEGIGLPDLETLARYRQPASR